MDMNMFLFEHDDKHNFNSYALNKWGEDPDLVFLNDLECDELITGNATNKVTAGVCDNIMLLDNVGF